MFLSCHLNIGALFVQLGGGLLSLLALRINYFGIFQSKKWLCCFNWLTYNNRNTLTNLGEFPPAYKNHCFILFSIDKHSSNPA